MNSVHLVTQETTESNRAKKTESECTKPQPGPAGPACAHRLRPGCLAGRAPCACRAPRACLPRTPRAPCRARPERPAARCLLPALRALRSLVRPRACLRMHALRAPVPVRARPRTPSAQPSASAPTPAHASVPACAPAARPAPACARPAPFAPSPAPSHQAQLGSSPSRFCTKLFFFSSFFFHFFQPLENTKKIYLFIFFHFPVNQ